MDKDIFISAHEELIQEYLNEHPNASWEEAYNSTAESAYGRCKEKWADVIDQTKQRLKDEGRWP